MTADELNQILDQIRTGETLRTLRGAHRIVFPETLDGPDVGIGHTIARSLRESA